MKRLLGLFIVFILFSACNQGGDAKFAKEAIPAEDMVGIFVDLHLAEASILHRDTPVSPTYSEKMELFQSILEKHNITASQLSRSLKYYIENTEELEKIYDKVVVELSKMQSNIREEEKISPQ